MTGLMHRAAAVAAACAALMAAPAAQAALNIGGLSLDEAGFADTLVSSTGVFTTSSGTLADALTDGSLSTWAMSTLAFRR